MARSVPPIINEKWLSIPDEQTADLVSIEVESEKWYEWLQKATSFAFRSEAGEFTARRERFQRGGSYWKAYRYYQGKIYQTYLGKDGDISVHKLQEAARQLAERTAAVSSQQSAEKIEAVERDGEDVIVPSPIRGERARVRGDNFSDSPIDASKTASSSALLVTKVQKPVVSKRLVNRAGLLKRLTQIFSSRLTLISAPPGSGKTTLILWWLKESESPITAAWHSIDQEDNDVVRFWQYFVQAVEQVLPGLSQNVVSLLQPLNAPQLVSSIINHLAATPQEMVIVLDDYHLITSEAIHQEMQMFLERLPAHVHLVITSRTDPPWPLGKLRVRGELNELRAGDLRFSPSEAGTFLRQVMDLELSEEAVGALQERTEGWIAGLQLAALGMRGHTNPTAFIASFKGSHRFVLDYLAEEVLERQSEKVRNFLLQSSILKHLTAELVEAITGCEDGQEILSELEQANLFIIPLDQERRWYRYHHLFADYLYSRLLQEQADHVPLLRQWAAQWHEEQGMFEEGIEYFLLAEEFDQASRLINKVARDMAQRGQWKTLARWIETLPSTVLENSPRMSLHYAWIQVTRDRLESAEHYIQITESLLRSDNPEEELSPDKLVLLGEVAAISVRLAAKLGKGSKVIELSERALRLLPANDFVIRSVIMWTQAITYMGMGQLDAAYRAFVEAEKLAIKCDSSNTALASVISLAEIHWQRGQLRQAMQTYQRALQTKAWQTNPFMGAINIALAQVLYEWNDLERASQHLHQGIQLLKLSDNIYNLLQGYAILARVGQAQGDLEAAQVALEQAGQVLTRTEWVESISLVERARVQYWLASGELSLAEKWVDMVLSNETKKTALLREYEILTVAQVRLAQNHPQATLDLLSAELKIAHAAGRDRNIIKMMVLQALAFYQQGKLEQALEKLRQALEMAEPEGYIRLFTDEGAPMAELFQKLTLQKLERRLSKYLHKLLVSFKIQLEQFQPKEIIQPAVPAYGYSQEIITNSMIEPLSEREHEVLRLLASSLSSIEIAQELNVAPSTVRTHIQNIYGKLGVQRRIQAIARAKEVQLL